MNQQTNPNTEPNRCLKCQKEIEPQYYYCDSCSDKRMKIQLAGTILLSALILFGTAFIITLLKSILRVSLGGLSTAVIYTAVFALIGFLWKKFIHADSKLREVPEEDTPEKKKIIKPVDETLLTVGVDVADGVHLFKATDPDKRSFITVYKSGISNDRFYIIIKKKKKAKLKSGDKIKLSNCEIVTKG